MKIKPDYKGRKDQYDDETFRYWEKIKDNEYYYEIYVVIKNKKARIIITDYGVSIDFKKAGTSIHTNIVPNKLFPNQKSLKWGQISKIIETLENTGIEGNKFSKEQMDELYNKWVKLGKP